ncbi:SCO1/SenC-domain-containing protein [Mycotypha africana]|uniref:SCO1/SenC-domain-containing protein n=1 Tax=Mycotypha africana TaxID=64632 RepID=UPI002300557B|nr:SCO1/SenC-domain-containing protein [Mycotypha africana]KAI8984648.1 SCO1/SenC-domain-containing protein [Mycotypha africana]
MSVIRTFTKSKLGARSSQLLSYSILPKRTVTTATPYFRADKIATCNNKQPCRFTSSSRFYASSSATSTEKIRARAAMGPFTLKAAAVFVGVGAGLLLYFNREKKRVEAIRQQKIEEHHNKKTVESYGKPKLGGPYTLIHADTEKPFGSENLKGKFNIVYFGFTHCPDICPDELDKMAEVVDKVKKDLKEDNILVPVFITCDPRRDTPAVVKEYVKDFHEDLIGLTGTEEEIRKVAKLFRVYVSSPPDAADDNDYLVDHSIFFYLMDPEGQFLDCYAQNSKAEDVVDSFKKYYEAYTTQGGQLDRTDIFKKQ